MTVFSKLYIILAMGEASKLDKIAKTYGNPYQETKFAKSSCIKEILRDFKETREVSLGGTRNEKSMEFLCCARR